MGNEKAGDIKNWVRTAIKKGYSRENIKELLLKKGYKQEQILKILSVYGKFKDKEEKPMKNKAIISKNTLLITIIIIAVLIIGSIIYLWKTETPNPVKNIINEIMGNSGNEQNNPPNNNDVNASANGQGSSSGGSSGGGGGGSGSGGSSSGNNCVKREISYSMTNPQEISTCNEYNEEICVDKTIKCYIEVENLNQELEGIFKLKIDFIEQGNETGLIDTKTKEMKISSLQTEIFEDFTRIQSTGQNGMANKEIDCFYNTLEIPYAEVCN